ncbi:hypothetical protein D9619_011048 [Psilocybe cf. subviscida]|uniref:BTB domain-containing protein n=1 Tax=Psilocybe cf. subviscida TaxID=2480587 RepID=A0A8H5B8I4_9AGAR|nr:hypothetical protein D9619_011048 [Psilocybe cf. subviscida]
MAMTESGDARKHTVLHDSPTVSPLFNDPHADVTFCSHDKIHFKLQRKYLEANTGAFPGAEFDTQGEIVHLQESAAVLSVLFGFTSPKAHPDIEELDFKLLAAVAEAAEKYEVFYAMNICRMQMRQFTAKHPLEILSHAAKHDYPKLIRDVAPALVRHPVVFVAEQLPPRYLVPWLRYHEKWDLIFDSAAKYIFGLQLATSPRTTYQRNAYFSTSMQGQACHSCILAMLKKVQEMKEILSVDELTTVLKQPHPPLLSTCIASSCQYTLVMSKVCTDMQAKIEGMDPFSLT